MTGHHACFRMREMFGSHQRQAIQPHIVHRARCGTNVARTLRTYQNDGNLSCVWPCAHSLCNLSCMVIPLCSHCSTVISYPHRAHVPSAHSDNFDISAFFDYYEPPSEINRAS